MALLLISVGARPFFYQYIKNTEINIFIGGSNNFINEPVHTKAAGRSILCTR